MAPCVVEPRPSRQRIVVSAAEHQALLRVRQAVHSCGSSISAKCLARALVDKHKLLVTVRTGLPDGFQGLVHSFLLVQLTSGGPAILVDPQFRDQFQYAALPGGSYASCVAALPQLFLGTLHALTTLVNLVATALLREAGAKGHELPPWRSKRALLTNWLPSRFTDTVITPVGSSLHPVLLHTCHTAAFHPVGPPPPQHHHQQQQGQRRRGASAVGRCVPDAQVTASSCEEPQWGSSDVDEVSGAAASPYQDVSGASGCGADTPSCMPSCKVVTGFSMADGDCRCGHCSIGSRAEQAIPAVPAGHVRGGGHVATDSDEGSSSGQQGARCSNSSGGADVEAVVCPADRARTSFCGGEPNAASASTADCDNPRGVHATKEPTRTRPPSRRVSGLTLSLATAGLIKKRPLDQLPQALGTVVWQRKVAERPGSQPGEQPATVRPGAPVRRSSEGCGSPEACWCPALKGTPASDARTPPLRGGDVSHKLAKPHQQQQLLLLQTRRNAQEGMAPAVPSALETQAKIAGRPALAWSGPSLASGAPCVRWEYPSRIVTVRPVGQSRLVKV